MNIGEKVNTNQSILGKDLLEWITADRTTKTEEERTISSKLYHKYVIDRDGSEKKKIFPNVYYYVNYNNKFNESVYLAYIVRDKAKSPRNIPDTLVTLDITDGSDSYKGSLIQEWSYYQNGSSENPFYIEGCDIITHYFESSHPLRRNIYYRVVRTSKGIKVFRDLDKSPRFEQELEV